MIKRKLFLLNRSLHRDLGYLSIGLTIIFSLSGLALNHRDDWNPNYAITRTQVKVSENQLSDQEIEFLAIKEFKIKERKKGEFWVSPDELKIFFDADQTVVYNKKQGILLYEGLSPRFLLKSFNQLHLNDLKGLWIVISDLYAIILFYLAISALFMVKGKKGILGRGGILTAIGLIIPAYFIWFKLS